MHLSASAQRFRDRRQAIEDDRVRAARRARRGLIAVVGLSCVVWLTLLMFLSLR
jgi:hypothetical protein